MREQQGEWGGMKGNDTQKGKGRREVLKGGAFPGVPPVHSEF